MKQQPKPECRVKAFTLVEMISVLGVISILMVIVAPSFINLEPSRKAKMGEIYTFIEMAQAQAMATRQDLFVCFANQDFPVEEFRYRAVTLFKAASPSEESKPIDTRNLRQTESWLKLPADLMFGIHADFKSDRKTVLDSDLKRNFSFSIEGKSFEVELPYLLFNKTGRIEIPVFEEPELYVALVDGYLDESGERVVLGSDKDQVGEFLVLNPKSGKISHLRD